MEYLFSGREMEQCFLGAKEKVLMEKQQELNVSMEITRRIHKILLRPHYTVYNCGFGRLSVLLNKYSIEGLGRSQKLFYPACGIYKACLGAWVWLFTVTGMCLCDYSYLYWEWHVDCCGAVRISAPCCYKTGYDKGEFSRKKRYARTVATSQSQHVLFNKTWNHRLES